MADKASKAGAGVKTRAKAGASSKRSRVLRPQPRSLSPDLLASPDLYKAGMYAELQKFKNTKTDRQLMLFGGLTEEEIEAQVEVTGLDLTVSEDKALSALQILLHQTNYKGHSGQEMASEAFKFRGWLPILQITYSEYFRAYGLQRKEDGSFNNHQAQEALEALKSLEEPRRICYSRKKWSGDKKDRRQLQDIIVTNRPLAIITKGYKDLEEEEAATVKAGGDVPQKRVQKLLIEVSPLLVDGIESFYTLKPAALHQQIQAISGSKRVPRSHSLFIEWLLTKNQQKVKTLRDTLAERLRLDYLLKTRQKSRLDKLLKDCFRIAIELGYLLEYQEDNFGMLIFTLSPSHCHRLQSTPEESDPAL